MSEHDDKATSEHEEQNARAKSARGKHSQDKNEGEGNRTADRKYREGVKRHVESGDSERAADEAQRAVDSDEGDELRRAEDEAKSGRKR